MVAPVTHLSLVNAESRSHVCIQHRLPICSSGGGHLGCFQFGAIMNNAAKGADSQVRV